MPLDSLPLADQPARAGGLVKRPSTLVNRNITVGARRTSVRLEPAMWDALHHVAEREGKSLNCLATEIARHQLESSLTAAIRVYLMSYFRAAATEAGIARLSRA